jgi:hypothetical protein
MGRQTSEDQAKLVNYAGGDGTVTGKEKPTKSCDTGKLYFLWRVVGLSTKTFAAELPKRLLNWVYTENPKNES